MKEESGLATHTQAVDVDALQDYNTQTWRNRRKETQHSGSVQIPIC